MQKISRIFAVVLAFSLGIGLLGLFNVQAQGDSPTQTPVPTTSPDDGDTTQEVQSEVEWTVGETTFESHYPAGFTFTTTITSSAGPLARGRVVWSHAPGTQRSRPAEIDPDTGVLTATWEATGADAVPPWVGITYYWDVTDEAGNFFNSEPGYEEYEDNSREWIRTESEDIIVVTESLPEDVGEMVVDAMEENREKYREAWGDLLPYKPRAILFGSREGWNEWQITAGNPNVVGQTSDDWGGTVQVVYSGDLEDLAYGTVPHEVAHLYQSAFTIMTPGSWFIEGNATFFEIHQQYNYEASVRELAASGNLPVLLQDTGPGVSGRNARRGYDIGYTFWKWLTDNYGLEGHRELIELLDSGMSRNQAIEQVTGLTIDEVESQWRVWLGASAVAPTLIPTPTLFIFPTVTPFGQ